MTESDNSPESSQHWAEGAVVYQIYPRSFKDSDEDGIGDLPGITSKFDYLKDLGVNAVWLSPFYKSPMHDFGYDVADYKDVDPVFGTLADAKRLFRAAHERDIKVLVDLVPNHSSDEHEWFKTSASSRDNRYANWYIWKDPKGHDKSGRPLPPNNWIEVFSGESAWQWHPKRQQFYLHSFNVHQPDLNWENPKVREAIKDVMRFWLDLGADGFRVDAVPFIAKDKDFADDPDNPEWTEGPWARYGRLTHTNSQGGPKLYEYLSELASVLKEDAYKDRQPFMVTEGYPRTKNRIAEYIAYYKGVDSSVAAPFNFEGLALPWEARAWHHFLDAFHGELQELGEHVIASYAFSNHDNSRPVSRLGLEKARAAAVLLLSLPGMVYIYNGDEIGMHDVDIPKEFIHDPDAAGGVGRDPERTPFQWTPGHLAGFTDGDSTWLPVSADYPLVNAETESVDAGSFLSLYRRLAELRNDSAALKRGKLELLPVHHHVLAFKRQHGDESYMTLINYSDDTVTYDVDEPLQELVISSNPDAEPTEDMANIVTLVPNEAAIFKVK